MATLYAYHHSGPRAVNHSRATHLSVCDIFEWNRSGAWRLANATMNTFYLHNLYKFSLLSFRILVGLVWRCAWVTVRRTQWLFSYEFYQWNDARNRLMRCKIAAFNMHEWVVSVCSRFACISRRVEHGHRCRDIACVVGVVERVINAACERQKRAVRHSCHFKWCREARNEERKTRINFDANKTVRSIKLCIYSRSLGLLVQNSMSSSRCALHVARSFIDKINKCHFYFAFCATK